MIRLPSALPLLLLAAALARGAGLDERAQRILGVDHPSSPAYAHAALPTWDASASGPLRPLPNGFRVLEYVVFDGNQQVQLDFVFTPRDKIEADWQFTQVSTKQQRLFNQRPNPGLHVELYINGSGNHGFAYEQDKLNGWQAKSTAVNTNRYKFGVDGPNKKMYRGSTTWNISDLSSMTDADCGTVPMSIGRYVSSDDRLAPRAKCYGVKVWRSGDLVRDYIPVADASGVAALYDRVSGQTFHSATSTPLVAGPEVVDLESVDALLPSSRNWYRAWLSAPNPPAATPGAVAVDALVLPVGISSPIRDQTNALVEALVAEPPMLRALVQRYRSGIAPTNIPVNLSHDPSQVVGSVANLWWVEGEGVWARLLVPESVASAGLRPSCEILGLRAQATDSWGTWGDFWLPWQIRGVALVERPALATPVVVAAEGRGRSPYPGVVR